MTRDTKKPRRPRPLAVLAAAASVTACAGAIDAAPGSESAGDRPSGPAPAAGSSSKAPPPPSGTSAPSPMTPVAVACRASGPEVGPAPLRRLTQLEYGNAIKDLVGAAVDVALEADDAADAFAVGGNLTARGVDAYIKAAAKVAEAAVVDRLAPCAGGAAAEEGCAQRFISAFGRRAFRRPLDDEERQRYAALYAEGKGEGGYAAGLKKVIEGMVMSPHFLYRPEIGEGAAAGAARPLTGYEIATRLAFFLWRRPPDDPLLDVAAAGQLKTAEGIEAQARKMLQDPRARQTVRTFYDELIGLGALASRTEATAYKAWNAELAAALREDALRFVEHGIFDGDGTLKTLMTASYGFVKGELGAVYGKGPGGADFKRAEMPPSERYGLLTLPGVLAKNAKSDRNLPVERGKLIREEILCQPVASPPGDAAAQFPPAKAGETLRQRLERHRSDPACRACHELLDPIGLAFENYGVAGELRASENGLPIDASGKIVGTDDADGSVNGGVDVARKLAGSAHPKACATTKWLTYALGRVLEPADACAQSRTHEAFVKSGFNLRELLVAIAASPPNRFRPVTR